MEKKARGGQVKEVKKKQIYIGIKETILDFFGGEKEYKKAVIKFSEETSGIKNK